MLMFLDSNAAGLEQGQQKDGLQDTARDLERNKQ